MYKYTGVLGPDLEQTCSATGVTLQSIPTAQRDSVDDATISIVPVTSYVRLYMSQFPCTHSLTCPDCSRARTLEDANSRLVDQLLNSRKIEKVLRIGDKIRFSVEVVEELRRDPLTDTVVLEVANITTDDDGTKNIWVRQQIPTENA